MGFFKKKPTDDALRELVDGLSGALGPKLLSVLLYGSKASGEFREGLSNVNVFIFLEEASAKTLDLMAPAVQSWTKAGQTMPVLVPKSELQFCADSLPIEFLDLLDHHQVLFGQDPLRGLQVSRTNLRAQCAQELSVKLLKLRQALILAKGNAKRMRTVLTAFSSGLFTLYRAVLRLEVGAPAGHKILAAKELAKRAGIEGHFLERLWDVHLRRQTDNVEDLARDCLAGLEGVMAYLHRK